MFDVRVLVSQSKIRKITSAFIKCLWSTKWLMKIKCFFNIACDLCERLVGTEPIIFFKIACNFSLLNFFKVDGTRNINSTNKLYYFQNK